ncbi:MAG TPA: dTMP kinase [bacterium]
MKHKGLFITFEGPEGSGKTTQLKRLGEFLRKRHVPSILTREPGGSKLSTHLRHWILNQLEYKLTPEAELHLFLADRAQHVKEVLLPALQKRKVVLCDRYTDSTLAYQGGGRGFDLGLLKQMNTNVSSGLTPDLTILFDLPVEEGLKRAAGRGKGNDRMESEALSFHRKVRKVFVKLAQKHRRRFLVLNAKRSEDEVFDAMLEKIAFRVPRSWRLKFLP